MGLFGPRRANSKTPGQLEAKATLSPRKSSRLSSISGLFAEDAKGNNAPGTPVTDTGFSGDVPAPTVSLDDFVQRSLVSPDADTTLLKNQVTDGARPRASMDRKDRGRSTTANTNQDRTMQRAESVSMLARRNSIKRSVSRKIARSESRRHMLNIKDSSLQEDRNPNLTMKRSTSIRSSDRKYANRGLDRSTSSQVAPRERKMAVNMSRSSSFCARVQALDSKDKPFTLDNNTIVEVAENLGELTLADDVDEELETTHASLRDLSNLQTAYSGEANTTKETKAKHGPKDTLVRNHSKLRKRPPPLKAKEEDKSEADSTTDWPSGGYFGSDGGFMTGGFRITAEGMLDKPPAVTRQDSDVVDGEVPQSEEIIIIVKGLKEFRTGPTIGTGAAGRVYIAEHVPSKRPMAMKVVNVYEKQRRNQLLKELETLSTHVSRYLVRFYGAFYDGSGAVHIALEYMDHGCLATFIQRVGPIPEKVVQMIAHDCVKGLRFLHRHHVLHRDFKTANILLSRRLCRAKLSDFGLARDLNPGVSKVDTFVGTVAYMSPERLNGSKYTYASDIWALGVCIMECLMGKYPFDRPQNYFDYIEATMTMNVLSGFNRECQRFSPEVRDFVTKCTYTDPKSRPTVAELLEHPWLKGAKRDSELFGSWLDECRIISMRPNAAKGRRLQGM
ncbi:Mitogen-activated protein kinase kinase 3 [Gracilariopsis chorda]|uniref:mitogen-activated protein kinase kinase n=1 Tax=Gracilariopsis chorda TaxID=448386 RepID=A0A2V3IYW4_9FLOR|nr:Mitogen-activated protein kinase kinase 3 [Gracilariopsis chorda]|eukprot:PXF46877.1 Mitogen-activated protein kinase kinase 3 [Gracilariopsis chorda]